MWSSSAPCRPRVTRRFPAPGRPASARPRKFRPVLEALEARLAPAVFNVTSLADSNVAGSGSLRAAISTSNATAGPNTIDIITPGTYALTLNGTATDNSAGELAILNNDVTIVNQSGGTVVIDAGGLTTPERVFDISPTGNGINVTITGVTIQGGDAGIGFGGGIKANGTSTLTLNNDIVQNNSATKGGGVAAVSGDVTLNATTVRNNTAALNGGGVRTGTGAGSIFVLRGSVITRNIAGGLAGGIEAGAGGSIFVTDSFVTNNQAAGGSGGGISNFEGGGDITVTNSIVSGNAQTGAGAVLGGGGIAMAGPGKLTIKNSLIANNSSASTQLGAGGGGIAADGTGDVTITGSEISGNSAAGGGGGLLNTTDAAVTISASTFSNNQSSTSGGGVFLETTKTATLTNVTISGNRAVAGGGLAYAAASGIITLNNDTIAFNSATTGNAGGVFSDSANGILDAINTIIAKNTAGGADNDVDNVVVANPLGMVDGGGNFIGDNTGASNSFPAGSPNVHGSFVGAAPATLDPLLDPLTDNGGSVVLPDGSHPLTHQDGADNGNNGVRDRAVNGQLSDERGFPVAGTGRDIGAFEFQGFDVAVSTSAPAGTVRAGQPATFTLTVTNNVQNTSRGVTLTATLPAGTTVVGASGSFTVSGNVVTFAVPDLPVNGSASFTLTVVPAAPGAFTETAAVSSHDDTNLANNTASATVNVLPAAFPPTGFADVTGLLDIMPLGPHRGRPHKLLFLLLTNVSGTPIQGPMGVVVPGPRGRGAKLVNASGTTTGGQKFVLVNVPGDGVFEPGQSAIVELVLSKPSRRPLLDVLAGAFA